MSYWRTWARQPQTLGVRKAVFQVHLWTGIVLAAYVIAISLSGSVLVYRNELLGMFAPKPVFVERGPRLLSQDQLEAAVKRSFPDYQVTRVWRGASPNQAVELELTRRGVGRRNLFDPYTGENLGHSVPLGFRFTAWLLDFHDNLLSGDTGRRSNGVAAAMVIVSAVSGLVVWWPGVQRWRRSLTIDRRANWRPFTWSLHSALGIWSVGFVLMWGITGLYLSYPKPFNVAVEYAFPLNESQPAESIGDRVLYWLGYAHFGRFGGRIPGCGRGTCDDIFKAVWAAIGSCRS